MKIYLSILTNFLLAGAMSLGLGASLRGQDYPPASEQPEEIPAPRAPERSAQYPPQQPASDSEAARVSFIHGDLSTQHSGDSSEWVAATLNTPIVNGDHISTGERSRAEIQLDHATVLRLSDKTTANVVDLSRSQIQLQVGQGLVNLDVLRDSDASVEIQTPNVAIRPDREEGSYRITVNSDGETIVDVRRGSAEISTPQGSTRVEHDQRITIQGNADDAQYNVSAPHSMDDWDKWNSDRDRVIEGASSWRHTDPYYTGTHDLDTYGHWNNVPDYGGVWFPDAGPDWAPYREGRWVFEPYYGWTWVSYEPWGWAPYHYGRWFVYGGRWGWWPGPVSVGYRPIWAPAYVSFFGFGGEGWGVGVGFGGGFGSVGWLPCGPGDRFYPWYGRGRTEVNVVNITNIHNNYGGGYAPLREGPHGYSNIDRAFSDPHVRSGVTSMRSSEFGHGTVPAHQQPVDTVSLRKASVITGGHPVTPSRDSFRPSDRPVSPAAIPNRASTNQHFYNGTTRPTGPSQGQSARNGFNRGGNPSANQPQQNSTRPGFRSFGPSNNSGNSGNPGNVNRGAVPEQSGRPYQGNPQSQGNSRSQRGFTSPPAQQSSPNSSARPGFRSFGPSNNSGNSGGLNRGAVPEQSGRPYGNSVQTPGNSQSQRGFTPPPARQQPSANSSARPGWRPFTPPPSQSSPSQASPRNYGEQSRPSYSQPSESPRSYQSNPRAGSSTGYSRPPINMQQPIVTPRGGSYSSPRSAPSGGGSYAAPRSAPNTGGYHGAPPSQGNRGGNYGGGSRGGDSRGGNSQGGHPSTSRNNR